jgi:hypothetical protein
MKLTKNQILIGTGLVSVVGLYLVIKYYMNSQETEDVTTQNNGTTSESVDNTQKKSSSTFPIKKGDKDKGSPLKPVGKVVNLQRLINEKGYINVADKFKGKPLMKLVEDGIFGPKTESALVFYINKKSIDNQNDLDALKNAISPALPQ